MKDAENEKVIIAHPTVIKAMKEYDYDGSPADPDEMMDKYNDLLEKNRSYNEPPVQIRWVTEMDFGARPMYSFASHILNTTV